MTADFLARAELKLRHDGRLGLLRQVLTLQLLDNVELGDWGRARTAAYDALSRLFDPADPAFHPTERDAEELLRAAPLPLPPEPSARICTGPSPNWASAHAPSLSRGYGAPRP
jgi:hypothetical protein